MELRELKYIASIGKKQNNGPLLELYISQQLYINPCVK